MASLKENVGQFNDDVRDNLGYRYTTNAQYSSLAANARMTKAIVDRIPAQVRTVIDIGSGDGVHTNELKLARADLEVTGFDPAEEAVRIASTRFANLRFHTGNILKTESLPNTMYDLGVFRGVLHHVSDAALAIRNSALFCRSLLIIEPNGNNPILKLIEKFSKYHIDHEEQSFSSPTLRRWCREGGWQVESQSFTGFVPFFSPKPFAMMMAALQPILEKLPIVPTIGAANIVLACKNENET